MGPWALLGCVPSRDPNRKFSPSPVMRRELAVWHIRLCVERKSLILVMGTTQNRSTRWRSRHSWRPLLCLALSWALEALRKKAQQGGGGEPLQSGVITAVTGPVLSGCPRKSDGALSPGQGAGKPRRQCGSIERTPDLTLPPSWRQDSSWPDSAEAGGKSTQLEQKERVIRGAFLKGVTCGLRLKDEFQPGAAGGKGNENTGQPR